MKAAQNPLKNMSLKWKIMLSFVVILLLPLIFAAGYVYKNSVKSIEVESMSSLQGMLKAKKIEIDQKLDSYEEFARKIAVNPVIASYVDNTDLTDLEKTNITNTYLKPFFDWMKGFSSDDLDIKIFTENRNVYESENIYHFEEIQNSNFYSKALSSTYNDPYWYTFHKQNTYKYSQSSKKDSGYEISLFLPIMSVYDGKKSLVNINLNSDTVFRSFSDSIILKDGYMFVLDANGDPILDLVSTTGTKGKILKGWASDIKKENQAISSIMSISGEAYFINYQDIPKLQCSIISIYPQKKVIQAAERNRNILIFTFAVGIALLLAFSYFFSRGLMKNIKELLQVMKRVQKGDMTTKAVIHGMDEIGELGQDFNVMLDKINQLIESVYKAEILQKDALLMALQNQMNPHFLYNALETIKMLAEIDRNIQVSDALTSLGSLVRYNLSVKNNLVYLSEELNQIESYCCLQNLMINNRLNLNIDLDEEVLQVRMLKSILQPIVENSMIHGFHNYDGICDISISGCLKKNRVRIDIMDNGKGMSEERLAELRNWICERDDNNGFVTNGSGIGLRNVHQRILLKYGEEYGLTIESTPESGTKVSVAFPAL